MGQHEAIADMEKNRLYIKAEGFFTEEELLRNAMQEFEAVGKLKPGFDLIAELSGLSVIAQRHMTEIPRVQTALIELGLRRTVLIVGESLARMQLERKYREAGLKPDYASSLEQAERMLDGLE